MTKHSGTASAAQSSVNRSMRFALLVLCQRTFLHPLESVVHPMLSDGQRVVLSFTFGCESLFVLQLNYSRTPSQRNTGVRPPRCSFTSCCGFNGIAVMYDSL